MPRSVPEQEGERRTDVASSQAMNDTGPRRGVIPDAALDAPVAISFVHRLRFANDALDPQSSALVDVLQPMVEGGRVRVLAFVDAAAGGDGGRTAERIAAYARAHADEMGLAGPIEILEGGEPCKNDGAVLDRILGAIEKAELCRHSYVVAVGGGALLDVVGYAAAVAHRGIRLVRLPTTTLSQADSGVGVKNGVNAFGKKNYLGSFSVPWAVINDESFLASLSERDWRSGFSEAVKVSLLKDPSLFERLRNGAEEVVRRRHEVAVPILRRSAELHLRHIAEGGDPFEATTARPLDLGHWSAHKLEQMTEFRLRHGEAVAIGLALDIVYARSAGILGDTEAEAVLDCLERLGFVLHDDAMRDVDGLLDGIEEFRQHLGGQLTITLIRGVGRPLEVHEMQPSGVRAAIEHLRLRSVGR
jgi:3-dehydroquinate synthase